MKRYRDGDDADKDDRDGGVVGGILKAMMSSLAGTHRTLGQFAGWWSLSVLCDHQSDSYEVNVM